MIRWMAALTLLVSTALLAAQPKIPQRFGIDADLEKYPQSSPNADPKESPKAALRSVVKAIEDKRIDYMLAHLADPQFVNDKVKAIGDFQKMVTDTKKKFDSDPESIRTIRKFLTDGVWAEPNGDVVEVKCDAVKNKKLYMKKIDDRWYLENRSGPVKDK